MTEENGWEHEDDKAIKHWNIAKHLAAIHLQFQHWIGKQVDLWGQELSAREAKKLNCRKNDRETAEGVTGITKQLNMDTLQNIWLLSTSKFDTWIGDQVDL